MHAVAYPAELKNGEVRMMTERPLHTERWSSWTYQSNRRITRRFEHGLEDHLNEGAYFRILLFSNDSPVPRYELNAKCPEDGHLVII